MSPFKEPQPRKVPIQEEHEAKQQRAWPPYERIGGEARWEDKGLPTPHACGPECEAASIQAVDPAPSLDAQRRMREWANEPQPPLMVVPDHTSFMARTAALEAAVQHAKNMGLDNSSQGVVIIADVFENYLRNGKPS